MNWKRVGGSAMLLLTASIWGFAFVAQSVGMNYIGPLTFNGLRFLIGSMVLLPVIFVSDIFIKKKNKDQELLKKNSWKNAFQRGIICGVLLCMAALLQQYGMLYYNRVNDPVGKSGFITALYIVLVPLFSLLFGKKVRWMVWIGALLSLGGLYLLCISEGMHISVGDLLTFLCAIVFSAHILYIDSIVHSADMVKVSCIQFATSGIICSVGMFLFESPSWENISQAYIPILFAGVCSCGIAYTFQLLGQKHVEPTTSSLIMSLEAAISVLAGWLILGQTLSSREYIGCVLMFIAIILVQLPEKRTSREATSQVGAPSREATSQVGAPSREATSQMVATIDIK